LTARGVHRVLRVARTIADLAEKETGPRDSPVGPVHLAEALQLRRAI
jgi:magnesium chelatase family protein